MPPRAGAPPPLHSFPTRRSSDLLRAGRLVAQMSRDDLRRTVQRYRIEVPAGWQAPPELRIPGPRSVHSGRELQMTVTRSEEHTSELQSPCNLVCRLLLEKKKHRT